MTVELSPTVDTTQKIAVHQKTWTDGKGTKALYRCSPPMPGCSYHEGEGPHEFVVASAVVAMFSGAETYIFPADATGEITSWGELDGSFQGAMDNDEALRRAGYEVIR